MALVPCASCDRHRRADASVCPFCGGNETVASEPRLVARTTRTALVLGGMALGIVGCVSHANIYGAPPSEPRVDAGIELPADGGSPAVDPDAGKSEAGGGTMDASAKAT